MSMIQQLSDGGPSIQNFFLYETPCIHTLLYVSSIYWIYIIANSMQPESISLCTESLVSMEHCWQRRHAAVSGIRIIALDKTKTALLTYI